MSNFLAGKIGEFLFEEALRQRGCVVIKTGQEEIFGTPQLPIIRELSLKSPCSETRENCIRIRKTKDYTVIFPDIEPHGSLCWNIELKTKFSNFPRNLVNILRSNTFKTELEEIFNFNPGSRLLINDIPYQTFRIIDSNKPLDLESQYINWYQPWKVIPFIKSKEEWQYFYEKYFTVAVSDSSKKWTAIREYHE